MACAWTPLAPLIDGYALKGAGHQAEHDQDRKRMMQQSDRHEPEGGDEGQHHHGFAQYLTPLGEGCDEWQHGETGE